MTQVAELNHTAAIAEPADVGVHMLQGGDTETTGVDAKNDRIVEIALMNFDARTGRSDPSNSLHIYLNPEMDVGEESVKVHGLTNEFLAGQPVFLEKRDEIIAALENKTFVAHNASFDVRMIEAELKRSSKRGAPKPTFESLNCTVIDTLPLSRRFVRTACGRHNLDALLAHFGIPATGREEHHGALVDVALLARVYPHIKAVEKATLDAVSQHFSFHLATKVEGANGDELIRRSMELEELIAFLKEEQSLIKEQFVSGIGNVTWQGQTFGSTYTPGAKRTEWDKVKAAHLAEVDLTPYQKDVAGSLKFHRNES